MGFLFRLFSFYLLPIVKPDQHYFPKNTYRFLASHKAFHFFELYLGFLGENPLSQLRSRESLLEGPALYYTLTTF